MFNLSRQEKIVFLVICSVILATFGWKLYSKGKDCVTIIPSTEEIKIGTPVTEGTVEEEICIIHIAGAVHQPGVYQLNKGKRIIDAVKMAGGKTEMANLDAVNLAAHLYDGQKIIIPMISENNEDMLFRTVGSYEAEQQRTNSTNSSLLNLNAANSLQLEALPGIGPVLADRILEYRKSNGMFRNMEEVMNIPGIGEKKFDSIKEYITVY
jgi:competence protein ComEA